MSMKSSSIYPFETAHRSSAEEESFCQGDRNCHATIEPDHPHQKTEERKGGRHSHTRDESLELRTRLRTVSGQSRVRRVRLSPSSPLVLSQEFFTIGFGQDELQVHECSAVVVELTTLDSLDVARLWVLLLPVAVYALWPGSGPGERTLGADLICPQSSAFFLRHMYVLLVAPEVRKPLETSMATGERAGFHSFLGARCGMMARPLASLFRRRLRLCKHQRCLTCRMHPGKSKAGGVAVGIYNTRVFDRKFAGRRVRRADGVAESGVARPRLEPVSRVITYGMWCGRVWIHPHIMRPGVKGRDICGVIVPIGEL